ncbi:MAG TPA: glycerophosphodiester phosphodiesterase [Lachnospiraceae bacterium]|nr:glycerophosphodiester phosphodiesterase [Lachnospiraceae bacterium]
MNPTEIFAHRGASGYAPENTIPAFELAHRQGADGIELDVQMTKDGEVVVLHDETIDRVSTGRGPVREYTLKELRQFSFHNGMETYAGGVKIPTLAEVLRLARPWEMQVNIELKTGIYWYPGLEKKTAEIVRNEGMEKQVLYSSFNHYSIREIQRLIPGAQTAYLFSDVALDMPGYARYYGVDGLHPSLSQMQMPGFLEEYKKSGLDLRVWTVNREEDLEMLFLAGVTAVITNVPDVAVKVRRESGRKK